MSQPISERLALAEAADIRSAIIADASNPANSWAVSIPLPRAIRKQVEASCDTLRYELAMAQLQLVVALAASLHSAAHAIPLIAGLKLQLPYMLNRLVRTFPESRPRVYEALRALKSTGFEEGTLAIIGRALEPTAVVPRPPSPPLPPSTSAVPSASSPPASLSYGGLGGLQPPWTAHRAQPVPPSSTAVMPVSTGVLAEEHIPLGSWAQLARVARSSGEAGSYGVVDLSSTAAAQAMRVPPIEAGRIEARLQEFLRRAHSIQQESMEKEAHGHEAYHLRQQEQVHWGDGEGQPEDEEEEGEGDGGIDARKGKRSRYDRKHILEDRSRYTAHAFDRYTEDRDLSAAGRAAAASARAVGGPGIGSDQADRPEIGT